MQLTIMAEELSSGISTATGPETATPVKPQQRQRSDSTHSDDGDEASVGTCSTASLSDHSSTASCDATTTSSSSASEDTSSPSSLVGTTTSPPPKQKRSRRVRGRKNRGGKNKNSQKSKKQQKQQQPQLTAEEQQQYLAMDCEMVGVGPYGRYSAVARVTLVDWMGSVVYDEYCAVAQPVTDYRTAVSGITPELLATARYSFGEIQLAVYELIQDKILIGHALKNDLHALGLEHAWQQTRDTAKYEPFMHFNAALGRLGPRKLKDLAEQHLHQPIQVAGEAHCPIEDARTALELYKLKRTKWEKVMEYKIQRTAEIMQQQQTNQQ